MSHTSHARRIRSVARDTADTRKSQSGEPDAAPAPDASFGSISAMRAGTNLPVLTSKLAMHAPASPAPTITMSASRFIAAPHRAPGAADAHRIPGSDAKARPWRVGPDRTAAAPDCEPCARLDADWRT